MTWFKKDEEEAVGDEPVSAPRARLVEGGVTLRDQINKRWSNRDKRSDGWIGDRAHQARKSDHNPDSQGWVHAIDVDEDLRGSKMDMEWLARQLMAYARTKKGGSRRLKYLVYEDRIASGTYARRFWVWRHGSWGHQQHMHVSFTTHGEDDGSKWELPILTEGEAGVWDGKVPFFDVLEDAIRSGAKNKATWRLACRLKELGFYSGKIQPLYEQGYPKNAVRAMQDWMGWERREYDPKTHKTIFGKVPYMDEDGYEG